MAARGRVVKLLVAGCLLVTPAFVSASAVASTHLHPAHASVAAKKPPRPTVKSASHRSGHVGTTIVIKGKNFIAPISIEFGKAAAAGSFTTSKITVTAPSHGLGTVRIKVRTAGGVAERQPKFTYKRKPATH